MEKKRGRPRREEAKGGCVQFVLRGKQAESPVRGKFTLVWWEAGVEERKIRCCRGYSQRARETVAESERESVSELRVVPVREESILSEKEGTVRR